MDGRQERDPVAMDPYNLSRLEQVRLFEDTQLVLLRSRNFVERLYEQHAAVENRIWHPDSFTSSLSGMFGEQRLWVANLNHTINQALEHARCGDDALLFNMQTAAYTDFPTSRPSFPPLNWQETKGKLLDLFKEAMDTIPYPGWDLAFEARVSGFQTTDALHSHLQATAPNAEDEDEPDNQRVVSFKEPEPKPARHGQKSKPHVDPKTPAASAQKPRPHEEPKASTPPAPQPKPASRTAHTSEQQASPRHRRRSRSRSRSASRRRSRSRHRSRDPPRQRASDSVRRSLTPEAIGGDGQQRHITPTVAADLKRAKDGSYKSQPVTIAEKDFFARSRNNYHSQPRAKELTVIPPRDPTPRIYKMRH